MSFHAFLGGSPTMLVGSVLTWAPWRFNFLLTWVLYRSFLARMMASSNAMHHCKLWHCPPLEFPKLVSCLPCVQKNVFYEMFDGHVVDTQCKLRYSKIFGELRTSCLRSFGVMFRQPKKTKSIKINNQVTMLMCFLVIDVGTWFLKHGIGS